MSRRKSNDVGFKQTGITREDVIKLVVNKAHIQAFLLDIQNQYRIRRSIQKDPEDAWLHIADGIDAIMEQLESLEPRLNEMKAMEEPPSE